MMHYYAVVSFVAVVIGGGIAWLNIHDHRRRCAMTPEERRLEDEETQREMQIW